MEIAGCDLSTNLSHKEHLQDFEAQFSSLRAFLKKDAARLIRTAIGRIKYLPFQLSVIQLIFHTT
jgi:hypothetical protein